MASKKTKASGRNVKEAERNTEAKKFRLHYETAADIEELAESIGCTESHLVEAAIDLFKAMLNGDAPPDYVHELIETAAARSESENDASN